MVIDFKRGDKRDRKSSRTGGNVSEVKELICYITEEMNHICDKKELQKEDATKPQNRKLDNSRKFIAL